MAIIQTLTDSFKQQLLLGVHDFRSGGDVFRLALYAASANLGAHTTSYTSSGEVTGAGYTAGGRNLSGVQVGFTEGVAFVTFGPLVFPTATFTARGALIYNATPSALGADGQPLVNPAVAVLNFGSDRVATGQDFTIMFPPAGSSTAIIRVE